MNIKTHNLPCSVAAVPPDSSAASKAVPLMVKIFILSFDFTVVTALPTGRKVMVLLKSVHINNDYVSDSTVYIYMEIVNMNMNTVCPIN